MCATSINTFARVFNAPGGVDVKAAGCYNNTVMARNTKIFLGLISLGLLYGLAELIEHVANVKPKIQELAKLNCDLYNMVVARKPGAAVRIDIGNGNIIRFYEKEGQVYASDEDDNDEECDEELPAVRAMGAASFEALLLKIKQDAVKNPTIYAGLKLMPTIGAAIDLGIAHRDADQEVLEEVRLALFSAAMPATKEEFFEKLVREFGRIVNVDFFPEVGDVCYDMETMLMRSNLITFRQGHEVVWHSPIAKSFHNFMSAAYPQPSVHILGQHRANN